MRFSAGCDKIPGKSKEKSTPIYEKAILLLLALCCLTLPAQAAGFYDLPADHWAGSQIQEALNAGAVTGYGDGSFQPGRDVTAAQFCAILSRSFLSEELTAAPEGKYQAMDACLSVLEGTSVERAYRGLGKVWSHFVNEPLSRYDMAQVVYNLLDKWDSLPDQARREDARERIADWEAIPAYYRPAVSACCAAGILQGQSDDRFAGEEPLNRAQACVVWSRLNALLNPREPGTEPPPEEGNPVPAVEIPAFGLQEDETVQHMMDRINAATPPLPGGPPAQRQGPDRREHPGASGPGEGGLSRRYGLEFHPPLRLQGPQPGPHQGLPVLRHGGQRLRLR